MSAAPDRALLRARQQLLGVGAAVAALGLFALWRSFSIRQPKGYTVVGPRVVPWTVAGGLIVLGVAFVVHVALGRETWLEEQVAAGRATATARTPALLVATLIAYATLLRPVGYVVTTAVFLPLAAFLLGSRKPLRDLTVGIVMSVAVFVVFHRLLGIHLPSGVLGETL